MAVDQRKRQKKLERRAAKRKQRHRHLTRVKNRGLAERLGACASAPILHCRVSETLWDEGMGNLVISRELPNGEVALGCFLVDAWCLGIKDAFGRIATRGEYNDFLKNCDRRAAMIDLEPEDARKLIEDAVEYARRLGFEPHPDYHRARPILGDIDASAATRKFTFGMDGKPHFMAGPHDSPARCQQIISILEDSCGRGGYHFTLPADGLTGWIDAEASRLEDDDGDVEYDDFEDEEFEDDDEEPTRRLL